MRGTREEFWFYANSSFCWDSIGSSVSVESISSSLRIEFSLMLFFFYQEGSLYETRVPRWRIKKLGDGDTSGKK